MRKLNFALLGASLLIVSLAACKSKVTLADVQAQEEKALKKVAEARSASLKLVDLRERFSADEKERQIAQFENRLSEIKSSLKNLGQVGDGNKDAQGGVDSAVKSLEAERKAVAQKLAQAKQRPLENWQPSAVQIQQLLDSVEAELKKIKGPGSNK